MRRTLAVIVFVLGAVGLFAISAKVVDADGPATVRTSAGKTEKVAIGRIYTTGDSIRTGKDGLVELSQQGLTIRIGPSTVFTLMERELGGKPTGVLAVTLGAVRMKYDRLTGSEPLIQSVGCVAGVRGTELTVWAGSDGASRFIVESGMVTVEAYDRSVELGPDEAVEVMNGQPPGEKFVVQRGLIDHEKWDQGRIEALLADPPAAIEGLRERLAHYAENAASLRSEYQASLARLEAERERVKAVEQEQGRAAARAYEREQVAPLLQPTRNLFLNARYFLLAGFAMRRFVGSRMYVLLKVDYLGDADNPLWTGFVKQYDEFLRDFDTRISPFLVEADY